MGAAVDYREAAGLIVVREYDELTDDEFNDSVSQIREICATTGCDRVLVDATEQVSRTDAVAAFERASSAARALQAFAIRIAVVVAPQLFKDHALFQTMSVNRGLKVQLFVDEAGARTWLDQ